MCQRYNSSPLRLFRRRQKAPKRRKIRKLRVLALLLIMGALGLAAFSYGLVMAVAGEIPGCDPTQKHPEVNGYIYANDGHTILAVLRGSQARVIVGSGQIAPVMKQAIVAVEDKRFYEHRGLDLRGISRAVWADITSGKSVQGGSTITQQFVKNACGAHERSFARKIHEATLAWQLEQRWSKDRILTAYLNTIYFGNGAYGIQEAALVYFGHSADKLTLPESALLAGIPADPSVYDPVTDRKAAFLRRKLVLEDMLAQGDITYNQFRLANRTPVPRPEDVRLPGTQGPAPYFVNYVKQQLVDHYPTRKVFGGGLKVQTSIDLGLQQIAHAAIHKGLPGPTQPSAALVAIDPRDGRVLAMVGGRNFRESQFNLAVQGERQPGSSFKPFVLATALAEGVSPDTVFVSHPVAISLGDRIWYVHNYEGSNLGPIDVANATVVSDNTVFAQLTDLVGPDKVAGMAHALGITSKLNAYFAIGLGAEAVNPLEMARAFSTFAAGGNRVDGTLFGNHPRAILAVNGDVNQPTPVRALSQNNAAIIDGLLQRVVTEGTGKRAALPDRPAAGKTGTTENYGDAWFVGYTPQLSVAVWVGYPNGLKPMLTEFNGSPVAGGTFPALIWKSFMEKALPYLKDSPQSFPSGSYPPETTRQLVERDGRWQLDNGLCRNLVDIVYFEGHGPGRTADCKPNEVEVPNVVGDTFAQARARLALQPLSSEVVYKPASPGQAIGIVLRQYPARGHLSSHEKVTLVLAKPQHGIVPSVVGQKPARARKSLLKLGLKLSISFAPADPARRGVVLSQRPKGGVAAGPGLLIRLVIGRG